MMFVLGSYWVRDPLWKVLGLKAQILVKICKSDVKTQQFMGAKSEVVNKS